MRPPRTDFRGKIGRVTVRPLVFHTLVTAPDAAVVSAGRLRLSRSVREPKPSAQATFGSECCCCSTDLTNSTSRRHSRKILRRESMTTGPRRAGCTKPPSHSRHGVAHWRRLEPDWSIGGNGTAYRSHGQSKFVGQFDGVLTESMGNPKFRIREFGSCAHRGPARRQRAKVLTEQGRTGRIPFPSASLRTTSGLSPPRTGGLEPSGLRRTCV